MPLSPTTKLGSYEVSGLLGKGGMGEVYRARDAKLGREVAIKTLPPNSANSVSPGPGTCGVARRGEMGLFNRAPDLPPEPR